MGTFSGPRLTHAQLRVLPTAPVDNQPHASHHRRRDDDLLDQRADEPLLGAHIRRRSVRRRLKIRRERRQRLGRDARRARRRSLGEPALTLPRRMSLVFYRASSSAATSRLSGSTAS